MANMLNLSATPARNPSTGEAGYRATVRSNGKNDMDALVELASKNTTMNKAEMRMAFDLMLDAIEQSLAEGKGVELRGIVTIGFTCNGPWTKTIAEQHSAQHRLGLSFHPGAVVRNALAKATFKWRHTTAAE